MRDDNGDDLIVRKLDWRAWTGLGPTEIADLIAENEFPTPFSLTPRGRVKALTAGQLRDWRRYRQALAGNTFAGNFVDWHAAHVAENASAKPRPSAHVPSQHPRVRDDGKSN